MMIKMYSTETSNSSIGTESCGSISSKYFNVKNLINCLTFLCYETYKVNDILRGPHF